MRKNRIAILSLLILLGNITSSCSRTFPLKVGDDAMDIFLVKGLKDEFWFDRYVFFSYDKMNYVVRYDENEMNENEAYISYIFSCKKSLAREEDFDRIEEEMLIYQVVELVGLPYLSPTSGVITARFKSNTGKRYSVHFYYSDPDDPNSDLAATHVECLS